MTVNISEKDSLVKAWKEGYNQSDEGFWSTTKGITSANWQYASHHPYKTAAAFVVIGAAISLTTAYFLSPAYAAFANTTTKLAYAGMIEGGKGLYVLAMTNPVFTGLLAAAIVVTIGTLMYMNYNKANQIGEQTSQINEQVSQIGEARRLLEGEKPESKIGELKKLFNISEEKTVPVIS